MLNKILFLTKERAKTKYTVCLDASEADSEDTLIITDNQEEARKYLSMDFAVLYTAKEDEFARGIPHHRRQRSRLGAFGGSRCLERHYKAI